MIDDLLQRPRSMSKPEEKDGVICPNSSDQKTPHPPQRVYDTVENGKKVRRGIIAPHKHGPVWERKDDCDYSGLPVPVVPRKVPEKERVSESEGK